MRLELCHREICSRESVVKIIESRFPQYEYELVPESDPWNVIIHNGREERDLYLEMELKSACQHLSDIKPSTQPSLPEIPPPKHPLRTSNKTHLDSVGSGPAVKSQEGITRPPRPDNICVTYRTANKDHLEFYLQSLFGMDPTICSRAPCSGDKSHATVFFQNTTKIELEKSRNKFPNLSIRNLGFTYSFDFDDITVLYDGSDETDGPLVDIIAIPGLGTNAFGTFRAPEGNDMWLRDFIKNDIKNVRVLLYGYPSKVDKSETDQNLFEISDSCGNRIHTFRRVTKTKDRPIVWLGQSLGGLIVHKVLCIETFSILRLSTIGVIGFGVPLSGLDNPSLLKATKGELNEAFLKSICLVDGETPPDLVELAEELVEVVMESGIKLVGFYEINPSTGLRDSNGEPKRHAKPSPILGVLENIKWAHKTHSGLVKFQDDTDADYRHTIDNIKSWLELDPRARNKGERKERNEKPNNRGKGKQPRRRSSETLVDSDLPSPTERKNKGKGKLVY